MYLVNFHLILARIQSTDNLFEIFLSIYARFSFSLLKLTLSCAVEEPVKGTPGDTYRALLWSTCSLCPRNCGGGRSLIIE